MFISALALSATILTGGALSPNASAADAAGYPYCTNSRTVSAKSGRDGRIYSWYTPATSSNNMECIASSAQAGTYGASTFRIQYAAKVLHRQSLVADGYYGPITASAVRSIQAAAGFSSKDRDGIYGP
jgi:hypothetical protein